MYIYKDAVLICFSRECDDEYQHKYEWLNNHSNYALIVTPSLTYAVIASELEQSFADEFGARDLMNP